ncbi:MAG: cytochrome P450 [Burkholderiaceae bacterium]|nr:cytochrome P450 [Burkholderiaceae bacterium]
MTSPSVNAGVPILDMDPYSDENIDNPSRFNEAIRDLGPVVWLKPHNMYAVGRFAEVEAVLGDDKRFLCTAGVGLTDIRKPESLREKNPLLEVEPDEHARVRSGLLKILSPAVLRTMKGTFEQKAEELVDKMIDLREFDGVHDLVEPYILGVFPQTVGIKINPETVLLFGDLNFNANGPLNDLYRNARKKVEQYLPEFEEAFRRENMVPGGMGAQIYDAEESGGFRPGTAVGFVRVLFRGGFDTTIAGIGATLYHLGQSGVAWDALRANPEGVFAAFDEALRVVSPARVMHRVTVPQGCELSGMQLQGDVKVGAYIAAANLDPRKYLDPDKYDMKRAGLANHLAFGTGATKCLGLLLAKYEAEAILKVLVRRVKTLQLLSDEHPGFKRINTLRTLKSLPLRVIPN